MRSPLLLLALAIHLVMAGSYAWRTPAFEGPDENSHYAYAWYIANAGKLPINQVLAAERGLPQSEGVELAHHPALYYALLAAVLAATGEGDTTFGPRDNPTLAQPQQPGRYLHFQHHERTPALLVLLRLTSVLLGAATIVVVFAFARVSCPAAPAVAGTAAVLVASLPMWSFLHGVLNSDVLATLLSSSTLLVCALLLRDEHSGARRFVALGALLGLAWLTKTTTLFLGGVALLTGLALLWRARGTARLRPTLARLLVAAAITIALSGWQFARSWSLYGDPLAMGAHDASFQTMPPQWVWPYFFGPLYIGEQAYPAGLVSFVPTVFTSLIGRFGWFARPVDPWLVWFGAASTAIALGGLVTALFTDRRLPRPLWLALLTMALVFAGTAYFNTKVAQPQGRLLFPAVAPAAALFAAGLVRATTWLPGRAWALGVFPLAGVLAFVTSFLPAFDPAHAPAPPDHRNLVGDIVTTSDESLRWDVAFDAPLTAAPILRWRDDSAPTGTTYTLYAFGDDGRVWLATHEWTKGTLPITGDAWQVPDAVWAFVPKGVPVSLRLRRVPTRADDDLATLPATPPLRVTRE